MIVLCSAALAGSSFKSHLLIQLPLTSHSTKNTSFNHSFAPHTYLSSPAVHVAEEILSWSSIGILGLFACELLAKLVCFGSQYFAHSRWHLLDAGE